MPETTLTAKSVRITETRPSGSAVPPPRARSRRTIWCVSRCIASARTSEPPAGSSPKPSSPPRRRPSTSSPRRARHSANSLCPRPSPQPRPAAQRRRQRRGPSPLAPSARAPTEHDIRSASRRSRRRSAHAAPGRRAHDTLTARRRQLCCALVDLEPLQSLGAHESRHPAPAPPDFCSPFEGERRTSRRSRPSPQEALPP